MNVGILTNGAFSAFQSTDWRSRFPILTDGAFSVFVVLEEPTVRLLYITDNLKKLFGDTNRR